jgi:chloramphenicol 3-O phosphotransferase
MQSGTILILNGTSSSGKTSLVRELQKRLDGPYLDAGLDRFLWMLPGRYLDRPLWDDVLGLADVAGETGHTLVRGMHHAIAALAKQGNNVVADHVLVEPRWVVECACLFAGLPAYLIGVNCPLELLEQREMQRKDRTLGQARKQFERVHAHGVYDFSVDTGAYSTVECAAQVCAFLAGGPQPRAFAELNQRFDIVPLT